MERYFTLPSDTEEFQYSFEGKLDLVGFRFTFFYSVFQQTTIVTIFGDYREDGVQVKKEYVLEPQETDAAHLMFEDVDGENIYFSVWKTENAYVIKMQGESMRRQKLKS
ncbi:MAG: hypothetical protein K6E18_00275 [Lachnospiraceae bacterium]|nr:hypothetical protein [Lachnospiraceae bacterium]